MSKDEEKWTNPTADELAAHVRAGGGYEWRWPDDVWRTGGGRHPDDIACEGLARGIEYRLTPLIDSNDLVSEPEEKAK